MVQSSKPTVVQLYAVTTGLSQITLQRVGAFNGFQAFVITLNSGDIVLQDADCNNTYGVCQKFCNQAEFCRLYCNPICCTSEEQRTKLCSTVAEWAYPHNSTKFRVTGPYFQTDTGAGIWAEDELWLHSTRGTTNVGSVAIALQVVRKAFFGRGGVHYIGLGRRSRTNSIVHVLHRRGYIDNAIVTIAYRGLHNQYYLLGEFNERYCEKDRRTVSVVGDLHWMFDAKQAAFLNHKTAEHNFRILLETDSITMMPREILRLLQETGIITPDYQKSEGDAHQNYYTINPKHLNDTFEFFFKLNKDLTLYSDLKSIDVKKWYFPETDTVVINAAALDPNPDRVEWVVGRVVLMKYCAFLDYNQNTIAFSPVIPPPYEMHGEEQRIKLCSTAANGAYQHNSTKFRVTGRHFRTEAGAGIWAEDELWLDSTRGIISVGTVPIALQVVQKAFSARSSDSVFGLGRQSKTHGIVHVLHRRGYIDDAIVTIASHGYYDRDYFMGEYNERYCEKDRQTVNVVGDLHWMFDAKQAAFLNHKTAKHDFRILLETDSITMMPRRILHSFLENSNPDEARRLNFATKTR
uniref:SMB domain-containing protein n=1 Tax=Bursaphelenchus xylophilus TaxID=6326 RepID=A0A1I7SRA0_BURXY